MEAKRIGLDFAQGKKRGAFAEQQPMDDLLEDAFGVACESRIIEKKMPSGKRFAQRRIIQVAHGGTLRESGFGLNEFKPGEQGASLILPAATGRQELLHGEHAHVHIDGIPPECETLVEGAEEGGAENGTGAKTGAFGHGAEERQLKTTAQSL